MVIQIKFREVTISIIRTLYSIAIKKIANNIIVMNNDNSAIIKFYYLRILHSLNISNRSNLNYLCLNLSG